jgi:hypothetical protein
MATIKFSDDAGLPQLRAVRRNSPYTWKVAQGQADPFGPRSEASSASTPRWQSGVVSPFAAPTAIEPDSAEVSFEEGLNEPAMELHDAHPVSQADDAAADDSQDTGCDYDGTGNPGQGTEFMEAVARLAATVQSIAASYLVDDRAHTVSCVRLLCSTRSASPSDFDLVVSAYAGAFHEFAAEHAGWHGVVYNDDDMARVGPAAVANERRMFPAAACPHPPTSDEFKAAAIAADIEVLAPLIIKLRFIVVDRAVRAYVRDNHRPLQVSHSSVAFAAKRFPRAFELHGQRSMRKFSQCLVKELRQERASSASGPLEERLREAGARAVFASR